MAAPSATATGSTTTATDPKAFYGYLFEVDKKPTKTLDALLRGIAGYISENIGNKDQKALTPDKLASFYKAVGGNYDSLFVDVPNPSISWIYASIGCQHTLQPTTDDFQPPCVPALTTRGFVRWQSIEILLGPEEHVPFIQNAVRDFNIKHPDTGELFPGPVPKEAFPLVADPEIEKWHDQCAQELRKRATPTESMPDERDFRPEMPPRPKVQATYVHVRPTRPSARPTSEYFPRTTRESVPGGPPPTSARPFYQHVHSATGQPVRPKLSRSPSHRARQFLAPEDDIATGPRTARTRRRSFPENMTASPTSPPNVEPVRSPMDDPRVRRHSHPRHARRGSMSSDASSSEDGGPPSPMDTERRRRRRRDYARPPDPDSPQVPPAGVRYSGPAPPVDPRLRPRGRVRVDEEEEVKRRSFPIPIDLSGKLSAPFLLGKRDRAAQAARSNSRNNGNLRWKDLDGPDLWRSSGGSMEEDERPATSGRRSGEYKRREREPRPRMSERRSSHEDGGGGGGRRSHSDRDAVPVSDRRSFRDRERERRYGSPIRGVDGRRYPAH
ncbi:uncharacterized protein LY89DRAFT_679553 [Mollisia scopiformis]|uniref:DUF7514 domain-containing protein n=1 Tax=Mollisia scopiformis TaxID=149040 RepID=A0A194XW78_MOLSC|nr:uncharacterized protein LY89DRAFT_679553 [Mollisia scopiformis]KUJ24396.1 hypothetical protein LY89DRAFT_679553 [Mollisia scopiformis]